MQYWWVNHKQTWKHELGGGLMWSPKMQAGGKRSHYYDNMILVEPGDIVFSYFDTHIQALGRALGPGYEAIRPPEFGAAGAGWDETGWRVDVQFVRLPETARFRPKDYIDDLAPLLPTKYSPISPKGNGNQVAYLTLTPEPLAEAVLAFTGVGGAAILDTLLAIDPALLDFESELHILDSIETAPLSETEKVALVLARVGQGKFRAGVKSVSATCRFTGIGTDALLSASHIKPWKQCTTHEERLDKYNGLMLTPTYDRLFDRGLISFTDSGSLLLSPQLAASDIDILGLEDYEAGPDFHPEHLPYLAYHRAKIFKAE